MPISETQIIPRVNILNAALGSTNDSIVVQIGDVQNEDPEDYTCQWVQQSGFASIPPNAIPNQTASEGVMIKTTDYSYIIACRDFNSQSKYGTLGPGEAVMYGAGPDGKSTASISCKSNSSATMSTNDSSGNLVYLQVSPTALSFVSPWGTLIFDKTGFHVNTVSGAGMTLGGFAAAGPLSTLIGNICNITASSTTIASPFISLGDGINTPFLSSMLPLTISSPVITLSSPVLMLGDVTTPMNILAPSALTLTSSALLTLTGATVTVTGITTITSLTGLLGIAPPSGGPVTPGAPAVGLPFVV